MLIHQNSPKAVRYDRTLRSIAQRLRHELTSAENVLWKCLKGKKVGYKFRRQHTLHGFIVDFYCYELMLVIEVDGGVHEYQKDSDRLRDQTLKQNGYTTLRFGNEDVVLSLPIILEAILKHRPLSCIGKRGGVIGV